MSVAVVVDALATRQDPPHRVRTSLRFDSTAMYCRVPLLLQLLLPVA